MRSWDWEIASIVGSESTLLRMYERADAGLRQRGRDWYFEANAEAVDLSNDFGITVDQAAGIIAVLSPMTNWESNLISARSFLDYGEAGSSFYRNVSKARSVLAGDLSMIRGPKVEAFWESIRNPGESEEICIDRHGFSAWMGRRATRRQLGWLSGSRKRIRMVQEDYRTAARRTEERPIEFQSIIWLTEREQHAAA